MSKQKNCAIFAIVLLTLCGCEGEIVIESRPSSDMHRQMSEEIDRLNEENKRLKRERKGVWEPSGPLIPS